MRCPACYYRFPSKRDLDGHKCTGYNPRDPYTGKARKQSATAGMPKSVADRLKFLN